MYVHEILFQENANWFKTLKEQCSQFLEESQGIPLLKALPKSYSDFRKVKVRKRKKEDLFNTTFNEAFEHEQLYLRQRAIFANGPSGLVCEDSSCEPFYVFPVDGFKFLYCKEVQNSNEDYRTVFESILHHVGEKKGIHVAADLFKFAYTQVNLNEGLASGSEIILYNIPYYYVMRESYWGNYTSLLTQLHELT